MVKRNFHYLLLLFLIADIIFSFYQHLHSRLDGDMASIILPSPYYQQVLDDPFGLKALVKHAVYASPNRFFSNWSESKYFKTMPFLVQHFSNPIDSIYISCAILKTAVQVFIIYVLACIISSTGNVLRKEFLIAAALITPLFQTAGFTDYMGIIDKSITYVFFYALPFSFLLLFFLPFYKAEFNRQPYAFNAVEKILLLIAIPVLCLGGPLIPATVLIVCPLVLINKWWFYFKQSKESLFQRVYNSVAQIPKELLIYFILITLFSLYSIYIGKSNSENLTNFKPLKERIMLVPMGIVSSLKNAGILLLLFMVILNTVMVRKNRHKEGAVKIITLLKWMVIFSIIYILLLPLGGYRNYRPNILRYDTIMPITICLIFAFGLTSLFLINNLTAQAGKIYLAFIVLCLVYFTVADHSIYNNNTCEKKSLSIIANSQVNIIEINGDWNCNVMSWDKITDYHYSSTNTQLLQYWGVINKEKFYYQK